MIIFPKYFFPIDAIPNKSVSKNFFYKFFLLKYFQNIAKYNFTGFPNLLPDVNQIYIYFFLIKLFIYLHLNLSMHKVLIHFISLSFLRFQTFNLTFVS